MTLYLIAYLVMGATALYWLFEGRARREFGDNLLQLALWPAWLLVGVIGVLSDLRKRRNRDRRRNAEWQEAIAECVQEGTMTVEEAVACAASGRYPAPKVVLPFGKGSQPTSEEA